MKDRIIWQKPNHKIRKRPQEYKKWNDKDKKNEHNENNNKNKIKKN